ncbi:MAG: hypothetical protein OEZ34_17485, partial [Spirochaetia bacterium]|nr:hypothetical protein [Spirochaetia bacterium]
LRADIKENRATGTLNIDSMDMEYRGEKCDNHETIIQNRNEISNECYKFRIEDISLLLPFSHSLYPTDSTKLHEKALPYMEFARNFQEKPNLTLRFAASTHNPRMTFQKDSFFFVGSIAPEAEAGVSAFVDYRNNILYINELKIVSLRPERAKKGIRLNQKGVVVGENIFFNLADLNPKNMEYSCFLQIKSLDLEPYLPKSKSGYNGIISGDMKISSFSLHDPIYSTDARISIYELSPEFSGFITRLIMPNQLAEGIIDRTLDIPSIDVQLAGGLIYTSIQIKREALGFGLLVRTSDEEIKQERIPLGRFLERAKSEFN